MDAAQNHIEVHPALVSLPLEVPVGAFRLLDRGVSELILDPPEVCAGLEGPCGVRVPHRVGLPIRELAGRRGVVFRAAAQPFEAGDELAVEHGNLTVEHERRGLEISHRGGQLREAAG